MKTTRKRQAGLQDEAKTFLDVRSRTTAYRAATYRPSLEKFQSTSFSDYVRCVLMGVPIDGVEPEEPSFEPYNDDEDDENEDEEHKNRKDNEKEVETENNSETNKEKEETEKRGDDENIQTNHIVNEIHMDADDDERSSATVETSESSTLKTEESSHASSSSNSTSNCNCVLSPANADVATCVPPPPFTAWSTRTEEKEQQTPTLTLPKVEAQKQETQNEKGQRKRMITRSQSGASSRLKPQPTKEKENIYSKQYGASSPSIGGKTAKPSLTKPKSSAVSSSATSTSTPPQSQPPRKRRIRGPPLQPDKLKLTDGTAKITPPKGWWDKAGIGADTTARGQSWQTGSKLGDMTIPGPIKQCVAGIGGVYDFTMMEQSSITVAEFRTRADAYRKQQMGKEVDNDESDDHMDLLARKFWKRIGPTMQSSQYGADMEGTLFEGVEACGWNVDKLESCLDLLEADYKDAEEVSERFRLPGVTSAYLYFGMWASVFAAHTEDMNLLSINYLHAGAPKYWYAIAQEDSGRFESLMESMFSHQKAMCNEFLRHKRSLISPSLLTKFGISYTTQVQRAGDIIITFPGSYHFGFNTGFNCAESTNFAVPEWVPIGDKANICMCHPHSVRIDMRRFKILLEKYEDDMFHREGPKLKYSEWAKDHIMKKSKKIKVADDEEEEDTGVSSSTMDQKDKSKPHLVEVMKLSSRRDLQSSSNRLHKKSKSKGSKTIEASHFRMALPMRTSHLTTQTPVLCLLNCDNDVECYFSGTIVDVVENHAKVHFSGSGRHEDVWLTIASGQLYLDGGGENDKAKVVQKKRTSSRTRTNSRRRSKG